VLNSDGNKGNIIEAKSELLQDRSIDASLVATSSMSSRMNGTTSRIGEIALTDVGEE
jgi:hypothetical protein